ncbi:hypothetical protein [Burkholderia gladioli]|uniref:hypothetical protein n=1 Tax=Burkholderia gladioli TaxID=28095 RepID=UPI00163E6F63|nr:hypothetical protein [Burkholderia gladioli]
MNDRELLELAAKAIGIQIECIEDEDGLGCARKTGGEPAWVAWSPLTDDGDALRLAVKLRLDLMPDGHSQEASTRNYSICVEEPNGDDPCGALRRAITRAAAEIERARITTEDGK